MCRSCSLARSRRAPVCRSSTPITKSSTPTAKRADPDDAQTIHTGRIVPVYEKAGAMTPKMQRRLVFDVLARLPADLPDPFPEEVRRRLNLPDRRAALMDDAFSSG